MPEENIDQFFNAYLAEVHDAIRRGLLGDFQRSLDELVSFHSFVLTASTVVENGKPIGSLSELSRGLFSSGNFEDWNRRYHPIIVAAVSSLPGDRGFFRSVCSLPVQLMDQCAKLVPARILQGFLSLGGNVAYRLVDWAVNALDEQLMRAATKEISEGGSLRGLALRCHQECLLEFSGSWETAASLSHIVFVTSRKKVHLDDAGLWENANSLWHFLSSHLSWTISFLSYAMWQNDGASSRRFADIVARWPINTLRYDIDNSDDEYRINGAFASFEAFSQKFQDVVVVDVYPRESAWHPRIPGFIKVVLKNLWRDTILVSVTLFLSWSQDDKRQVISKHIVRTILSGETLEPEDGDRQETKPFSNISDVLLALIRIGVSDWRVKGSYGYYLSEVVRTADYIREEQHVAGRGYTPKTMYEIGDLAYQFLVLISVWATYEDGRHYSQQSGEEASGRVAMPGQVKQAIEVLKSDRVPSQWRSNAAGFFRELFQMVPHLKHSDVYRLSDLLDGTMRGSSDVRRGMDIGIQLVADIAHSLQSRA